MKYSEYLASRKPVDRTQQRLEEHLETMLKLWRDTAVAVAGSSNCASAAAMMKFADQAVVDYEAMCKRAGWPI